MNKYLFTFVFWLISINAFAVNQEYLQRLKYEIIGINTKLPKKIDSITTIKEMRILNLSDGYYVATLVRIDSNIQTLGENRGFVRKNSIYTGCNDQKTFGYMKNGLKIGVIYENNTGKIFDQITYSLNDCFN